MAEQAGRASPKTWMLDPGVFSGEVWKVGEVGVELVSVESDRGYMEDDRGRQSTKQPY